MNHRRRLPLFFVLALGAVACSNVAEADGSTRDDAGTITEGGNTGVLTLRMGDCFDDPDGSSADGFAQVETIPCDEPHDNEVAAGFDTDLDGDYPGEDVVERRASLECSARFESLTGQVDGSSLLTFFPIYPLKGSRESGDRSVICSYYNADLSKLTQPVG